MYPTVQVRQVDWRAGMDGQPEKMKEVQKGQTDDQAAVLLGRAGVTVTDGRSGLKGDRPVAEILLQSAEAQTPIHRSLAISTGGYSTVINI